MKLSIAARVVVLGGLGLALLLAFADVLLQPRNSAMATAVEFLLTFGISLICEGLILGSIVGWVLLFRWRLGRKWRNE